MGENGDAALMHFKGFLDRFLSYRNQEDREEKRDRRLKLEREERLKEYARIWKVEQRSLFVRDMLTTCFA